MAPDPKRRAPKPKRGNTEGGKANKGFPVSEHDGRGNPRATTWNPDKGLPKRGGFVRYPN